MYIKELIRKRKSASIIDNPHTDQKKYLLSSTAITNSLRFLSLIMKLIRMLPYENSVATYTTT